MQANPRQDMMPCEIDEMDQRLNGMVKSAVPFDAELLEKAVDDPDVEEVRVFKLRHGSRVKIGDEIFKAFRVGKNVTLKKLL